MPQSFTLEEYNTLLLDIASYAFDDGPWQEEEELLRIDNLFRKHLGYPLRMEALAQPWINQAPIKSEHLLKLRFSIESSVYVENCLLAMEHPDGRNIFLNGKKVIGEQIGYFVDKSIAKVILGDIKKGLNQLEIHIPFHEKTNIEWCYLLGSFGVSTLGRKTRLEVMPERLYYGDITRQGFPFYGGNISYEVPIQCEGGILYIEIPHYRGALITVDVDGKSVGDIIFAPYRLCCGHVEEGKHILTIKVFGNRINAFGAIHHSDKTETWYGPNLWRTTGNKWSYEYCLEKMGILSTPMYWVSKES